MLELCLKYHDTCSDPYVAHIQKVAKLDEFVDVATKVVKKLIYVTDTGVRDTFTKVLHKIEGRILGGLMRWRGWKVGE